MSSLIASLSPDTPSHIPNPNLNPTITLPEDAAHNVLSVLTTDPPSAPNPSNPPTRLYTVTPLNFSPHLSSLSGHNIYLKLDCLQPSASFKMRGISQEVLAAHAVHGSATHVIISSGGNAGLAAATASKALGVRCTVFVPDTTEGEVVATLRGLGADVEIHGRNWNEADSKAREMLQADKQASYVHAFEGEALLEGHSSLSKEIFAQFPEARSKAGDQAQPGSSNLPEVIICSTGGGGLIHGILRGITSVQSTTQQPWRPLVLSCQDFGANSLNASYDRYLTDETHPTGPITLDAITSKATSMGTRTCGAGNLAAVIQYAKTGSLEGSGEYAAIKTAQSPTAGSPYLRSLTLEDRLSGSAAWQFYRDDSLIVEMACGASLAPVYAPHLLSELLKGLESAGSGEKKNVVIVVCGGSKTNMEILEEYKDAYGGMKGRASVDGREVFVG